MTRSRVVGRPKRVRAQEIRQADRDPNGNRQQRRAAARAARREAEGDAISARARGDWQAEREALDRLITLEPEETTP